MAVDPNSAVGQADKANDQIAGYFSALNKFLNGTGPLPDLASLIQGFDYSELHRIALNNQEGSANYSNGAIIENVHHMAAIAREAGLRGKTKIQYYIDGAGDAINEANYYSSVKTSYVSLIQGTSTNVVSS